MSTSMNIIRYNNDKEENDDSEDDEDMNQQYHNQNRPLRRKPMIHRGRPRAPSAFSNQNLPPSVISSQRGRGRARGARNPIYSARNNLHNQLNLSAEDIAEMRAAQAAGIPILGILLTQIQMECYLIFLLLFLCLTANQRILPYL